MEWKPSPRAWKVGERFDDELNDMDGGKRKAERSRELFLVRDESRPVARAEAEAGSNVGASDVSPRPEMLRLDRPPAAGKVALRGEDSQEDLERRSLSPPVRPMDTLTVYCVASEGRRAWLIQEGEGEPGVAGWGTSPKASSGSIVTKAVNDFGSSLFSR